jgi:hypothetical protein
LIGKHFGISLKLEEIILKEEKSHDEAIKVTL